MIQNLDIRCARGHYLFNNIIAKVQTKGTTVEDLCPKKLKAKKIKLAQVNTAKLLKQDKIKQKNRKKKV